MTQDTAASGASQRDWSKTLFLPKTDFPMKAGLPQLEPKLLARWAEIDLYAKLRASARGRARFTLHDGPPYANGHIHIGHALNKILKDLVTRSQQMLGFDSNYVPGWDCHGLPIEWKIEEEYIAKGKPKPNFKDPVALKAFRDECRAFAEKWLSIQREEFKRLGVEGDWQHPYTTMTFPAEAAIARELMTFAETDQLYRGSKPVMWSVVEKTALAEAEIEYQDFQSDAVYVKFPVKMSGSSTSNLDAELRSFYGDEAAPTYIVIWTTTPWTIPGNRAISFNNRINYGLYEITAAPENNWAKVGEKYILADKLAEGVMKAAKVETHARLRDVSAATLAALTCSHPLAGFPLSPSSRGEGAQRVGEGQPHAPTSTPGTEPAAATHPASGHLPPASAGRRKEGGYQFAVPLLDGDHVTDDAGTGFVHTAPGHGREDFDIWTASTRLLVSRGIDPAIPYTVDENGALTKDAPGFEGERVITDTGTKGKANDAVIKALADAGMMVARGRLKHQYPHSWRSKKPVIFRNTPQWFIHMDTVIPSLEAMSKAQRDGQQSKGRGQLEHNAPLARTLRETSLKSIRETQWVPASGQNRITGMIEAKPDWVVSRQRAWGVPITVFVEKATGAVLKDPRVNTRIYDAMFAEGADAWFAETDGARFLTPDFDPAFYEKINDVLDVWFDSGSTHAYVINDLHFPGLMGLKRRVDGGDDTVMYLEGSDQHRGWFHSSLIESSGTRGRAPFDVVLTHGFTMDEKGQKMSKSLGNGVEPQAIIKESGADILRLWVASCDYWDDQRIGPSIIKSCAESYRKMRNTLRWMLGTLAHLPADATGRLPVTGAGSVQYEEMPSLEKFMLHRLAELDGEVRHAYATYDYKKVIAALSQFMNTDLSAFYFDIRKDALYCDAPSSLKRRAALTCVEHIFRCVTVWLAPILVFTAEECWLARYPDKVPEGGSVHLELFPEVPAQWRDDTLAETWDKIRRVRRVVTGALEIERASKKIGSSLEAAPVVYIGDQGLRTAIDAIDLAEIAITSGASVVSDWSKRPESAFSMSDVANVAVVFHKAEGRKCARSWRITDDVGSDPAYPDLSARDAAAMRELDAAAQ